MQIEVNGGIAIWKLLVVGIAIWKVLVVKKEVAMKHGRRLIPLHWENFSGINFDFLSTRISLKLECIDTLCNTTLVICRRILYIVALKHKHSACAALLNPSSAEPLACPSRLKFISALNGEAKALLEQALMESNREREREKSVIKGTTFSLPSQ